MARKTARKKTRRVAKKKRTARKTGRATGRSTKKATRKTSRKKTTAAARKPARITPADAPRSKSEVYSLLAEHAGISKREVAAVFDTMGDIIKADLSKRGPGEFKVPGMMKVVVQRKPATKARKGINPFTGEETVFKAKPARNVVKVRPLKGLKELV